MLLLRSFAVLTVFVITMNAAVGDETIYNKIGIVKGRVFIINHTELGRTPAAGQYFVFQRMDCRRCMVGVRADIEGKYMAFLGVGRYRVICTDPESDGVDLIRKGQVREVVIKPRPDDSELNIELEIPKIR